MTRRDNAPQHATDCDLWYDGCNHCDHPGCPKGWAVQRPSGEQWCNDHDPDQSGRVLPPEPECPCAANGQPMTEIGVMHAVSCPWVAWLRATGGCMSDPDV